MDIIIYGNSDFADLMDYYFSSDSEYNVVGFCVEEKFLTSDNFKGRPLVAFENVETYFPVDKFKMFVAIGYRSMRLRAKLYKKTLSKGYSHVNYISSKCSIDKTCVVGNNNAILQGAVLEPFSKVGNNNVLYTSVIVCHHAVIENDCFLSARSLVGGYTKIKDNSFIGFSSVILQKLVIDAESLIAAGSVVNKSYSEYQFLAGAPAKLKSTHRDSGIIID